jgi:hypothetical protein
MIRLGHRHNLRHRRLNESLVRRRPKIHLKRDRRHVCFVYVENDVDYDRLVRFWMKHVLVVVQLMKLQVHPMLKLLPPNGTLFDINLEVFEKMNLDQQLHLAEKVQVEV